MDTESYTQDGEEGNSRFLRSLVKA